MYYSFSCFNGVLACVFSVVKGIILIQKHGIDYLKFNNFKSGIDSICTRTNFVIARPGQNKVLLINVWKHTTVAFKEAPVGTGCM